MFVQIFDFFQVLTALIVIFEGYPETHLNKNYASYVDSIHTSMSEGEAVDISAGRMGMITHVGHTDFYPNGDRNQLDFCEVHPSRIGNHLSAVYYFIYTLQGMNMTRKKCSGLNDILDGLFEECNGDKSEMGI